MTPVELGVVRNAVTDIEQGYTLVALSLLRSLLPPTATTMVPRWTRSVDTAPTRPAPVQPLTQMALATRAAGRWRDVRP